MAEISEVLDAYKKPLKTAELVNCVKNTMTGDLICMMEEDDDDDSGVKMEEEASEIERELLDGAGELLTAVARVDPAGVVSCGMADILTVSQFCYLEKKPCGCMHLNGNTDFSFFTIF